MTGVALFNDYFHFIERLGLMKYTESNLSSEILRAIKDMGFEEMTPIQEQAIPMLLAGKDVIGQAQTGTGKTAAFGIPLVMRINPKSRSLQGIVLCPTRELAIQAAEEIRRFAKYLHGIRVLPIYGGQEIYKQIKALKGGVQIIVGTPGRVMDHMRRHTIRMDEVRMVVLDEADEMLNMGFREDMETILKEIKGNHQTALFSATMPQPILDITGTYQKEDAVMVQVVKEELTIPLVKQSYYHVRSMYKEEVTARLLAYYDIHRALIFCNTKKMVDELAHNLKNRGFLAEGLHGDMSQHQRDVAMNRFRSGHLEILIATDVAARGIDVDEVEAVINYDVPQDIEYYVHRIGRTGRAGKEGKAFTLVSGREIYKIREIERICKTKMKERNVPSADAVTSTKAKKILGEAEKILNQGSDLDILKKYLEHSCNTEEKSLINIAAALLRMQMGDDIEEIYDMRDHVPKKVRGDKKENRKNFAGIQRNRHKSSKVVHGRNKESNGNRKQKGVKDIKRSPGKSGFRRERTTR